MRVLFLAFVFISFAAFGQTEKSKKKQETKKAETQIVEASCGMCNFGIKGGGCSLAVRIDGKAYPVDGSTLHEHGDAHGHDGMCNVVKKAEVSGEIVKGRFQATSFVILPDKESDAE